MANRYELEIIKESKWKNGSIYDYVMNSGWWAPANKGTYKSVDLKSDVLSAVREVLIDGQRTLPFYVDEHDWVGDLEKIVTNGKTYTSRSAFKIILTMFKIQQLFIIKWGQFILTIPIQLHQVIRLAIQVVPKIE